VDSWSPISSQILSPARSYPTKKLVLLGASGSIGNSTFEVLKHAEIDLVGVSVHSSLKRLCEILTDFPSVRYGAITGSVASADFEALKSRFQSVRFFCGSEGAGEMLAQARENGADTVLSAVVGAAGIKPTLAAISLGFKIALANKETMVTAGPVIEHALSCAKDVCILPVDSEHNALFQLLIGLDPQHLRRAILTASGGPFLSRSPDELKKVRREEVLNHPTWSMGPKITVDSAGLINKGLEIIEAHHLFGIPYDSLDVLIHPVSHVHAFVETTDGYRMMANRPSMLFPIAHSLFFPDPAPILPALATAPDAWPALTFRQVDENQFPGFSICMHAARAGGTAPAIFNAANEVAAGLFLDGLIQFTAIPRLTEMVLASSQIESGTEAELYLEADRRAREQALALSGKLGSG